MTRDDDVVDVAPEHPAGGDSQASGTAAPEEVHLQAVELPPPTREELDALRRERDDLKDQVLRRRADFENYRKRVDRDREQAAIETRAQLMIGLLPTLDNLDRALSAEVQPSALRDGVELISRNLLTFLESQGLSTQDPTGKVFDPQAHQALVQEPAPGVAEGTIVEVFRKAYFLKDRLLRPALVKVAKTEDGDSDRTD